MENLFFNHNLFAKLSNDEELTQFLSKIKDIGIIVYDEDDIDECETLGHYLSQNKLNEAVHHIYILGKKRNLEVYKLLSPYFPKTSIEKRNLSWNSEKAKNLDIYNLLIIHIVKTNSNTGIPSLFDNIDEHRLQNFISATRSAYALSIFRYRNEGHETYTVHKRLDLYDLDIQQARISENKITKFCKTRKEYLESLKEKLSPKTVFFQSYEEMKQGCEMCCNCSNYKTGKHCPLGQKAIATCYREGIFVPKDERIAHQWEMLAAKQGFKPAEIQVADDFLTGFGCTKDNKSAFEIYQKYATSSNDTYCIKKIIEMIDTDDSSIQMRAIPYIVQAAKNGEEEMILKLADAFKNGDLGLPVDMHQQKRWIEEGAEQGNPIFVKAMAEMYEDNKQWKECYRWYKQLREINPDLVSEDKLEETELLMLTDGQTIEGVAKLGNHYLHGYFGKKRDTHMALRCLLYASNHINPQALGLLGKMYYNGIEVAEDQKKGIQLLTKAAEQGDLLSMDLLLDINTDEDYGYDCKRWSDVIEEHIESEIIEENPIAYYLKGHYYSIGYKYPMDEDMALKYLKIAAERNIPQAQFELSELYADDDEDKSEYWLGQAAQNGDYRAQGKLGIRYSQIWHKKHNSETFEMLENAYKQGYDKATWALAKAYIYGWGTSKDLNKGFELAELAGNSGVPEAEETLCKGYFKGNEVLPKDYSSCIEWGEKAIQHGKNGVRFEVAYSSSSTGNHDRAKALYLELSNEGNGAAMNNYACELSDSTEAVEWFQKSANTGDDYGCWNLAKKLRDGIGVEKNMEKAISYFKKSAEKGNVHAMIDLAKVYLVGKGIEKDTQMALEWYNKAVEKDDIDAILAIGDIYQHGIGIDQNINKAIHYYKMAAEKENCSAFLHLGKIYENEVSTLNKLDTAIFWYRKAAEKGNAAGKENLVRLGSSWIENGEVVNEYKEEQDDDLPF